jgi:hypothetical protein|mmetsp:Transcript_64103/g.105819  ORF Transcript_64103/g.105819 Transcript_64103/m.105819 type:complete len:204 (-) Transcript_64103:199-810(-)
MSARISLWRDISGTPSRDVVCYGAHGSPMHGRNANGHAPPPLVQATPSDWCCPLMPEGSDRRCSNGQATPCPGPPPPPTLSSRVKPSPHAASRSEDGRGGPCQLPRAGVTWLVGADWPRAARCLVVCKSLIVYHGPERRNVEPHAPPTADRCRAPSPFSGAQACPQTEASPGRLWGFGTLLCAQACPKLETPPSFLQSAFPVC